MTIDERLERLAERDEALAQSMELISARTVGQTEEIAALRELIDSQNTRTVPNFEIGLDSIKGLERMASAHAEEIRDHDDRLKDLECQD